ncbi:hypothetical protein NX059_005026 [Plenodomus lindquistii]|nr:hypothetical protein NX059_005026 [Plenodomus lindquistii]
MPTSGQIPCVSPNLSAGRRHAMTVLESKIRNKTQQLKHYEIQCPTAKHAIARLETELEECDEQYARLKLVLAQEAEGHTSGVVTQTEPESSSATGNHNDATKLVEEATATEADAARKVGQQTVVQGNPPADNFVSTAGQCHQPIEDTTTTHIESANTLSVTKPTSNAPDTASAPRDTQLSLNLKILSHKVDTATATLKSLRNQQTHLLHKTNPSAAVEYKNLTGKITQARTLLLKLQDKYQGLEEEVQHRQKRKFDLYALELDIQRAEKRIKAQRADLEVWVEVVNALKSEVECGEKEVEELEMRRAGVVEELEGKDFSQGQCREQ